MYRGTNGKLFDQGDCVVHKLTGEKVLVLKAITYSDKYDTWIPGYYIRRSNYEVLKVAEFELIKRNV